MAGAAHVARGGTEIAIDVSAAFLGVLIGILAVDAIAALVLLRLHRVYRMPYLLFWGMSWLSHGIYQGAAAVSVELSTGRAADDPLRLAVSSVGFAFGYVYLLALYLGIESALEQLRFSKRRLRWMWLASALVGVVLVLASGGLSRELRFIMRLAPLTLIGAWVLVRGAFRVRRFAIETTTRIGCQLVAGIFLVFGAIRLWHFVILVLRYAGIELSPTSLTALFMLSVADLVLQAGMAFAMVIWFLEIERQNVLSAERRLRHAHRLESVGLLAGGIAHDFNNTLTVVLVYMELIQEKLARKLDVSAEVEQVMGAARRGASLTRQLLSFSRRQTLHTRIVDLSAVLLSLKPMLTRLLPENVEVSFELDDEGQYVETDSAELEQVIMNLVLNARDAMPDGGRLVIGTRRATARPSESHARVEGRFAVLSVTDTGIGMSERTLARVFDPFFTTKPSGEGTGLGLSVVYGFSTQTGGSVDVDSKPGKGTRIDIYLPLSDTPPEAIRAARSVIAEGSGTILLAEDDVGVRELVHRVLLENGYDVVVAADGQEATGLAESLEARFDLLITDVLMPRLGGLQLAERLREHRPNLPVLFISGHTGGEQIPLDALRNVDFIQKPFSPQVLSAAVRRLLEASSASGREAG